MSTTINCTRVKAPIIPLEDSVDSDLTRVNEISLPNPSGRGEVDTTRINRVKTKNLVKCRKHILVSTLNVRTLSSNLKRKEIIHQFNNKKIHILGFQDQFTATTTMKLKLILLMAVHL